MIKQSRNRTLKLAGLLNEKSYGGSYITRETMDDYAEEMYKRNRSKAIGNWKMSYDLMAGTIEWTNSKTKDVVLATPFWDGDYNNIPINFTDADGEEIFRSTKVAFKLTNNPKLNDQSYFSIMTKILNKLK
jgi:hypothetical protein